MQNTPKISSFLDILVICSGRKKNFSDLSAFVSVKCHIEKLRGQIINFQILWKKDFFNRFKFKKFRPDDETQ